MSHQQVQKELRAKGDKQRADHSQRFFKTGEGEYGEGDKFLGLRVPEQRRIAKKYRQLPLEEVGHLLHSAYHEERLTALLILTYKYEKADADQRAAIYHFYMENLDHVNNWDLVDSSAPKIVGAFLADKDRSVLYDLARSPDLWQRRVAMISCMYFINRYQFEDALHIAEILLEDDHDLIHKAVGWMLREIGNMDREIEEQFLQKHYHGMPRTMLRYAIEKFPEGKRQAYLKGKV